MTTEQELYAANRLVAQARESLAVHVDLLKERNRELEVVTQERDNALLRIEELERRAAPQPFSGPEFLYRAVHPNA